MDFCEKLQQLRKNANLTQQELAERLFVSRAAVAKWESGRGCPNIESLKDISKLFSVSIDDLLSGEKLLFLAEREAEERLRGMGVLWLALADLLYILPVILPLYPVRADDFVHSVSLANYTLLSSMKGFVYCALFVCLIILGVAKLIMIKIKAERSERVLSTASMALSVFAVVLLAVSRESYAVVVAFLILAGKVSIAFRFMKGR